MTSRKRRDLLKAAAFSFSAEESREFENLLLSLSLKHGILFFILFVRHQSIAKMGDDMPMWKGE
jgi:hypothetical protein